MGSSTRSNPAPIAKKNEVSTKRNDLILTIFNRFRDLGCGKKLKAPVENLALAWEELSNSVHNNNLSPCDSTFDLLFEQTLRLVLQGRWEHTGVAAHTHLQWMVRRFRIAVQNASNNHVVIVDRSLSLETIISEPWLHPVLKEILYKEPNLFDVLSYFRSECVRVIVIRLEILLQAGLEKLACKLSKSCLQAYRNSDGCLPYLSQNDRDYVSDIYYCSLYKIKKQDLISEIKHLTLNEGLRLLKRYRKSDGIAKEFNDHCKDARVWKCSCEVVELIADTLLTRATLNDSLVDSDTILPELLAEWAAIYQPAGERKLPEVALEIMKKLIIAASSSRCIYPFCAFMIERSELGNIDIKILEWLIRAINENINEIERYRVEVESPHLEPAYKRLAEAFVMVSKLFGNCVPICRECLLTSFSLLPSPERLAVLKTFVTDSQLTAVEEPLERVIALPNEAVPSIPENTSQSYVVPQPTDVNVVPAYYAELENLDIAESIKEDLNTILRYHRCPSLSWELKWSDLKDNCLKYLESFSVHRLTGDVELKFLNLDYNQFKNRPINYENFIGIEKGYEQYLPPSIEPVEPSWNAISDEDQQPSSDDSGSDYEETLKREKKKQKRKKCTGRFSASDGYSDRENAKFVDGSNNGRMAKRRKKHHSYVGSSAYQMKTDKKRVKSMSVMISEDLPPRVDENNCEAEKKQSGVGRKLKSSFPGKLFNVCEPYCKDVDVLSANRNVVNKLYESSVHRHSLTMRIKKVESEETGRSGDHVEEFRLTECAVVLRRLVCVESKENLLFNDELLSTVGSLKSSENSSPVTSSSSSSRANNKFRAEVESPEREDKSSQVVKPIILRRVKVTSESNTVSYEIVNS